ncbi:MAG: acyl-CoA thioesterase II [Agarilytica sp.]
MALPVDEILDLEKLDSNLFRSQHHYENFRKTLFGGQVLGQALKAAYETQEHALPHSFHAYFLRAGSSETPVIYDVENVRDGRSVSSRRVLARQYGRPIVNLSASFHKQEQGYEHQVPYPEHIPCPDELMDQRDQSHLGDKIFNQKSTFTPFDFLPIDQSLFSKGVIDPPQGYFWLKAKDKLQDNSAISHVCSLAFASDMGLLATALLPHSATIFDENLVVASIDHAMYFHRTDFRVDEWMLCQTQSPWAGSARGFATAHIFNQKHQLIATTFQEGLIRHI